MAIIVYNKKTDNYEGENVFYVGRGSIYGNPYTHIKDKETKAEIIVKTREKAIDLYKEYFVKMYNDNLWFKEEVDKIYELYKSGTDIYLGCYCVPLSCHAEFIKEFLISKLMKEKVTDILKNRKK